MTTEERIDQMADYLQEGYNLGLNYKNLCLLIMAIQDEVEDIRAHYLSGPNEEV